MKVLVTGGAGYLGSTLVPVLLDRGHFVTVLDSMSKPGFVFPVDGDPALQFHRVDVTDRLAVGPLLTGVDAVIHLAAVIDEEECRADKLRAYQVNAEAAQLLVELSRQASIPRLLFVSTASIYGVASCEKPATESDPPNARTIYANSKLQGEGAVLTAASDGFHPTVFRFASLMGISPIMRYDGLFNRLLLHAARDGTIPVRGDTSWRPCLHVRDAAEAMLRWLEADRRAFSGRLLNVGEGNYQKSYLANVVASAFPAARLQVESLDGDRDYCLDFSTSRELLGDYASGTPELAAAELSAAFRSGALELDPAA